MKSREGSGNFPPPGPPFRSRSRPARRLNSGDIQAEFDFSPSPHVFLGLPLDAGVIRGRIAWSSRHIMWRQWGAVPDNAFSLVTRLAESKACAIFFLDTNFIRTRKITTNAPDRKSVGPRCGGSELVVQSDLVITRIRTYFAGPTRRIS